MALGALSQQPALMGHDAHPPMGHLILLVFEAVMEVVCVAFPGYIIARQGHFDAESQKFVANLNVMLFTPCLSAYYYYRVAWGTANSFTVFTKLASQLTAETLVDLAVIPVIFVVQTLVSYLVSLAVSKAFGLAKRPANFVTAMGVFGNSNSLPISLVISLAQTLKGLHWDKIPGDNDDEVSARGILYLLIFQQLGQLVRWSWGYHVLLAPPEKAPETQEQEAVEEGRYRDDAPEDVLITGLDGQEENGHHDTYKPKATLNKSQSSSSFTSGGRTPVNAGYIASDDGEDSDHSDGSQRKPLLSDDAAHAERLRNNLTSFPQIRSRDSEGAYDAPAGIKSIIPRTKMHMKRAQHSVALKCASASHSVYDALPRPLQWVCTKILSGVSRFLKGLWAFMNPPLWAMLFAIIIASVPYLQRLFFEEGSFVANSFTRAVSQSGGVAVPLILVVLGANLARNTLPKAALDKDSEESKIGTKLLVASLISRMLLPTIIMAPILALVAKYVPVSIVDDPIFVIVCFLLTGAPSALQLAQICQINGVYEGVMSKILFQSYVIWYVHFLPSPLCNKQFTNEFLGSCHLLLSWLCAPWRSLSGLTQSRKRTSRLLQAKNKIATFIQIGACT